MKNQWEYKVTHFDPNIWIYESSSVSFKTLKDANNYIRKIKNKYYKEKKHYGGAYILLEKRKVYKLIKV